MSQSSGDEAAETDEMMPDAGIRDVAAAITSPDTLPFFMEEIKGSDWFASVQQPTRLVSWAKDSLPPDVAARIPPAASQVETDDRYAGVVVLFIFLLLSWILHVRRASLASARSSALANRRDARRDHRAPSASCRCSS